MLITLLPVVIVLITSSACKEDFVFLGDFISIFCSVFSSFSGLLHFSVKSCISGWINRYVGNWYLLYFILFNLLHFEFVFWTRRASQVAPAVKNPLLMQEAQETRGPSLGREDPPEEGMASHPRTLAWRIPWTGKPGGLQTIGSHWVEHDWRDSLHTPV